MLISATSGLDSSSLKEVTGGDTTVRPGGVACEVRACVEPWEFRFDGEGIHYLRLTEFADPEGKCVYFRLPDLSVTVPDELVPDKK